MDTTHQNIQNKLRQKRIWDQMTYEDQVYFSRAQRGTTPFRIPLFYLTIKSSNAHKNKNKLSKQYGDLKKLKINIAIIWEIAS